MMAIVSPLLKPATGPGTKAPPLREMPVQPALQVAVRFTNVPPNVIGALCIAELRAAPVTLVKLKAGGAGVVVTLQTPEVVGPMVTVVVVAVL